MRRALEIKHVLVMVIVFSGMTLLSGCPFQELLDSQSPDEEYVNPDAPDAPELTMKLPGTLSSVVISKEEQQTAQKVRSRVVDQPNCEQYLDQNANPMVDGYSLTKYLVGLSQSQSCLADFLIYHVLKSSPYTIGQGLITVPYNPADPDAPTHVQVEQSENSFQVWLFFAQQRDALDQAVDKLMYLTWTTVGTDTNGQFLWLRLAQGTTDSQAPSDLRVDFERHAESERNQIYLSFGDASATGFEGFRIDVSRSGIETAASYSAQGYMQFAVQPAENLPLETETFELPYLALKAVLSADGSGAAYWRLGNFGSHLENPAADIHVGSYSTDLHSTSYFDELGQITWITRGIRQASYVNTSGNNIRRNVSAILTCLENASASDTDPCGGMGPGMNLPGYFTDVCADADGADCTVFLQRFYDRGDYDPFLGKVTNGDPAAEPDDQRNVDLAALTVLETRFPDGVLAAEVFVAPNAP
ncbi:MAG: hypothetical protein OEZ43_13015 [Gammaproteobacteria bacterium]|nr:hypothetical protein [Gammaproteobacteria bacterium]